MCFLRPELCELIGTCHGVLASLWMAIWIQLVNGFCVWSEPKKVQLTTKTHIVFSWLFRTCRETLEKRVFSQKAMPLLRVDSDDSSLSFHGSPLDHWNAGWTGSKAWKGCRHCKLQGLSCFELRPPLWDREGVMKPALIVHIDRSLWKTWCFKLQLKNSIGQLQSKRRLQGYRKLNEFHRCFFSEMFWIKAFGCLYIMTAWGVDKLCMLVCQKAMVNLRRRRFCKFYAAHLQRCVPQKAYQCDCFAEMLWGWWVSSSKSFLNQTNSWL